MDTTTTTPERPRALLAPTQNRRRVDKELEAERKRVQEQSLELEAKRTELETKHAELEAERTELDRRAQKVQAEGAGVAARADQIGNDEAELFVQRQELETERRALAVISDELQARTTATDELRQNIDAWARQLEARKAELNELAALTNHRIEAADRAAIDNDARRHALDHQAVTLAQRETEIARLRAELMAEHRALVSEEPHLPAASPVSPGQASEPSEALRPPRYRIWRAASLFFVVGVATTSAVSLFFAPHSRTAVGRHPTESAHAPELPKASAVAYASVPAAAPQSNPIMTASMSSASSAATGPTLGVSTPAFSTASPAGASTTLLLADKRADGVANASAAQAGATTTATTHNAERAAIPRQVDETARQPTARKAGSTRAATAAASRAHTNEVTAATVASAAPRVPRLGELFDDDSNAVSINPIPTTRAEDIPALIKGHGSDFAPCLDAAKGRGEIATGDYTIAFGATVQPDGSIREIRLDDTAFAHAATLRKCLTDTAGRWRLSSPGKTIVVKTVAIGPLTVR